MANTLYDFGRYSFAHGDINWLGTADIKAILVDTGAYTPNYSAHAHASDIPSSAIIAGPAVLANRHIDSNGAVWADDRNFQAVSGPSIEAIILYQDLGSLAASILIAYIDTATGLPITPNGGDIIITWDRGPNRIFRL